jgi:hypothetical protein
MPGSTSQGWRETGATCLLFDTGLAKRRQNFISDIDTVTRKYRALMNDQVILLGFGNFSNNFEYQLFQFPEFFVLAHVQFFPELISIALDFAAQFTHFLFEIFTVRFLDYQGRFLQLSLNLFKLHSLCRDFFLLGVKFRFELGQNTFGVG